MPSWQKKRGILVIKLEKKQIRMVSLAIVLFFVLGIVGLALSQSGKSYAANLSGENIGIVNQQMLFSQHPDMAKVQETMKSEVEQARKDFDAKSASMNDTEKQQYSEQLQQRLQLKQQELVGPILNDVRAEIEKVAKDKGIAVVFDKNNVVYGGQDITDEVMKKLTAK
jgi:outer membrane protein